MKNNGFIIALKRLVISIIENDFYGMAAEMGFMMVIGIFPFMLLLMAVFGWMGNKSYMDPILLGLSSIMPEQAMNLILTVLSEVMIFEQGGTLAVIGIIVTIVLSTNGIAVVLKGLNRAYKVEETRNFVYTRILSFIMVFVNTLVYVFEILPPFGRLNDKMSRIILHFPSPSSAKGNFPHYNIPLWSCFKSINHRIIPL